MFGDDRRRIESQGRRAGSAIRVHDALKARPILSLHDGYLALLNQGT